MFSAAYPTFLQLKSSRVLRRTRVLAISKLIIIQRRCVCSSPLGKLAKSMDFQQASFFWSLQSVSPPLSVRGGEGSKKGIATNFLESCFVNAGAISSLTSKDGQSYLVLMDSAFECVKAHFSTFTQGRLQVFRCDAAIVSRSFFLKRRPILKNLANSACSGRACSRVSQIWGKKHRT